MEKDLSRYVARVAFKASTELGNLIPLLKSHCAEDEYVQLSKAIATSLATINLELLNILFNENPELKAEFEANIEQYGIVL